MREKANTHRATIDLVTHDPATGRVSLILVEQGPWTPGTERERLKALQARLYDYVDFAVDGHLAQRFPNTRGAPVHIQVDGYDLPNELVQPFVDRFAQFVAQAPERAALLGSTGQVASLSFEYAPRSR